MKKKHATLLSLIGILFLMLPNIYYTAVNFKILSITGLDGEVFWFVKFFNVFSIIGLVLLLPFFTIFLKDEKE